MKVSVSVRKALLQDAEDIASILAPYAEQKLLLPRTAQDISSHIGNFVVAESKGRVVGSCALRDYGNGLFEVRSLAVTKDIVGGGAGSSLVKACVDRAEELGAKRVFALTYRPHLFQRLGFKTVSKTLFPQKIWSDCSNCSKKDRCDEEAVMIEINEI